MKLGIEKRDKGERSVGEGHTIARALHCLGFKFQQPRSPRQNIIIFITNIIMMWFDRCPFSIPLIEPAGPMHAS